MVRTFYKAVRPDGTSFYDSSFRWIDGDSYGHIVEHPHPHLIDADGYLSVATTPTDCSGMGWPARLLTVEPVDGFFAPDPGGQPSKRAAGRWRVTGERVAHELLGPQGEHVVALIERMGEVGAAEKRAIRSLYAAARLGIAVNAALDASLDAARDAARDAAWSVPGASAAWREAAALVVRDLITVEDYDTLTLPWRRVVGPIHPDDKAPTTE